MRRPVKQITNQIQDLVPGGFFREAKFGGNRTVGPKNQHVPFAMMSPQTSLPALCFFFKTERPSGAISVAKSLASTPKLQTDAGCARRPNHRPAVVQVVHDFEATGFGQLANPTKLAPRILPSGSQDEAPLQFILLNDANFQNGFNKHLGRTSKPESSVRINSIRTLSISKPRQRGQEMLDGLDTDFAEFQNGASLGSTSKFYQRGDLHRRLQIGTNKHPTGPRLSRMQTQAAVFTGQKSGALQFNNRRHRSLEQA